MFSSLKTLRLIKRQLKNLHGACSVTVKIKFSISCEMSCSNLFGQLINNEINEPFKNFTNHYSTDVYRVLCTLKERPQKSVTERARLIIFMFHVINHVPVRKKKDFLISCILCMCKCI